MKTADFDYYLPPELIAQHPVQARDHSRLLVYNRNNDTIEDLQFFEILKYFQAGDLLFLNNSKVFPARIKFKKDSGGELEIFLLKNINREQNLWQCLVRGKIKSGQDYKLNQKTSFQVSQEADQTWQVSFSNSYQDLLDYLEKHAWTPLPPYIKREKKELVDKERYQTVYAQDDQRGSVAAPTAGLHFTEDLLKKIKEQGVQVLSGTLHVGWGTFSPIKSEKIIDHQMHEEDLSLSWSTIESLIQAKKEGRRIIAVGSTSCRLLESFSGLDISLDNKEASCKPGISFIKNLRSGEDGLSFSTNIFIYPGYEFKMLDALISNFHLPKSSLILLVSAFLGKEKTLELYQRAVQEKYRFFSYGDAMLII